MIAAKDLRAAIATLLKANFNGYRVHFDRIEQADEDYFYVELTPKRRTVDTVYFDRKISVDITLTLAPDKLNRVKRSRLYDAIDTLDTAIRPVFHVCDRYITVQSVMAHIVDDILHYEFDLDFTDYLPEEPCDLMEVLYINGYTEIDMDEEE